MDAIVEQLKGDIDLLNKYHYIHLNSLSDNDELYQAYVRFTSGLGLLDNKQQVIAILKSVYQPTNINVNTIGSALHGCTQAYYGDVDKNCSTLCVNNQLSNQSSCDQQIWLQVTENADLRFICLHKTASSQALIYVLPSFKFLTNLEKDALLENNVVEGQLFDTVYSKHYARTRMIELNDLPNENDSNCQNCQESLWKFSSLPLPAIDNVVWQEEKSSTNFYIIAGLLIICIIILILLLAFSL